MLKLAAAPKPVPLTTEQIEAIAHRTAWRYKKSSDPHHSDTYTFNRHTLIDFLRAVIEKADYHGGQFDIQSGNEKWIVTVTKEPS